ncbi:hypothetical protein OSG_eHP39_00060 [environmental Halophage eHP-39]|nr:hypothetical protein OSG_eHP39_00060 [environmental Halophage eHP-39]
MSPPIRDGSGSSIGSIRLGDGSEIAEVRTGAGDVLFSAIPDSEDLKTRYDTREVSFNDNDSVSTFEDQANNNDLTAGTAPTYKTNIVNSSLDVVRFDGSDDYLNTSFTQISQPITFGLLAVCRDGSEDFEVAFDGDSADSMDFRTDNTNSWQLQVANNIAGGSQDTNTHIWTGLFDGANTKLRVDGTQVASGDVGTSSVAGLTMGAQGSIANFGKWDIVEHLLYPQDKSSKFGEIEDYLDRDTSIL